VSGSNTPAASPIESGPTPKTGVPNVSSRRIGWQITNLVDRRSLMRFIRYLTATSTLLLTALLTLVLLFYSLSLALGAEEPNRAVECECIAAAVHFPATWCVDRITDGSRASRGFKTAARKRLRLAAGVRVTSKRQEFTIIRSESRFGLLGWPQTM
jgi:hypothetical protein